MDTKVCKRCGRELPVENFAFSKKNGDGKQSYCRDCMREYERERNRRKRAASQEVVVKVNGEPTTVLVEGDKALTEDGRWLYKVKTLADYSVRELLAELKSRGVKWTGMTIEQPIFFDKI